MLRDFGPWLEENDQPTELIDAVISIAWSATAPMEAELQNHSEQLTAMQWAPPADASERFLDAGALATITGAQRLIELLQGGPADAIAAEILDTFEAVVMKLTDLDVPANEVEAARANERSRMTNLAGLLRQQPVAIEASAAVEASFAAAPDLSMWAYEDEHPAARWLQPRYAGVLGGVLALLAVAAGSAISSMGRAIVYQYKLQALIAVVGVVAYYTAQAFYEDRRRRGYVLGTIGVLLISAPLLLGALVKPPPEMNASPTFDTTTAGKWSHSELGFSIKALHSGFASVDAAPPFDMKYWGAQMWTWVAQGSEDVVLVVASTRAWTESSLPTFWRSLQLQLREQGAMQFTETQRTRNLLRAVVDDTLHIGMRTITVARTGAGALVCAISTDSRFVGEQLAGLQSLP